ncbi:uncharacterized protein BJ171DRAFT_563758 [Polychytrium aggregatum]|uniref:uncharacterized protein n=1 Tax=Polychytrium aggregatum TaxID=110093 RepID=UPI0022FDE137|nr:uncharacterized protein BJ171DRAFT_563758 [Polychytrium aggregatum]KAI9190585.1 hypothetical protein BJ171DRAFT_563758 [Polychytrium aggregatum]
MSLKLIRLAAALLALSSGVLAQEGGATGPSTLNPSYKCDPTTCVMPKCYCASSNPPGGLTPAKIPQFITLTFDDAVNSVVEPVIYNLTNYHVNPNGCPLAATFFVSTQWTDYWRVQKLYGNGHEIACHTMNHIGNPPVEEIQGSQIALNHYGGVPKNSLLGFRHPFLLYSTQSYQNLASLGTFLYDSSMVVEANTPIWPYTLDFGPAIGCVTGSCTGNFSFPGLWSIPMPNLNNPDDTINTSMDPLATATAPLTSDGILAMLKFNFLKHYNGQRTPMGLFLHATPALPTIEPQRLTAYMQFISWTQSTYPDVYWVTNQQLLAWMRNPTDTQGSLTNPALGCTIAARDPSNAEVCDGVDNKGDGNIDIGLTESCSYMDQNAYFSSCFGCPSKAPNVSDPNPSTTSTRHFIPDAGCPNAGTWDPVAGQCVNLKRKVAVAGEAPFNPPPGIQIPGISNQSSTSPSQGSKSAAASRFDFSLALALVPAAAFALLTRHA